MIRVTQQQRRNAMAARFQMWPSVPPENVIRNLSNWRADDSNFRPDCNTVACFGGWCAWWPFFREQGVRADAEGMPYIGEGEPDQHGTFVALHLFGHRALFLPRGDHPADPHPWDDDRVTDHKLVTRRLDWLIANSEVDE